MGSNEELERRIEDVETVFDVDTILEEDMDEGYIRSYYWWNRFPYSIVHHKDLIHMGISRDGEFDPDDLLESARVVERNLPEDAEAVLELAAGRGANSEYLAERHPGVEFHGLDMSRAQLRYAYRKERSIENFHVHKGDYHDLGRFPESRFDAVFIIESLCYSNDLGSVFEEVGRVLPEGGLFIVLGGYRGMPLDEMSDTERIAQQLVERGMAVESFHLYEEMKETAADRGFELVSEEEVSLQTVPTMERFEDLASSYFSRPRAASVLATVLPGKFTYNAVAGYLMPTVVRAGLSEYWITILENAEHS